MKKHGMTAPGDSIRVRNRLSLPVLVGGVLLLFALLPGTVQAQDLTSGADFLRLQQGARGPAMAGAVTARPEGMLSVQYNPAGLARVESSKLEAGYQGMVLDINQGSVGGITEYSYGGFGFDINYVNYGSEDRTFLENGEPAPNQGSFSGSDIAFGLSYGQTILDSEVQEWAFGVTGRVIRSSIDDQTASALAADFGVHGRLLDGRVQTGLTLRNFGSDLTFDEESEDLPQSVRLGAAVRLHQSSRGDPYPYEIWVQGEFEDHHGGETPFYSGLELELQDRFFLRAGYDGRSDIGDPYRVGLGFVTEEGYFDYAFVPAEDFGENHRVALGINF